MPARLKVYQSKRTTLLNSPLKRKEKRRARMMRD
jgi:hypothetical protein